jgi:enoyl-CoA hydratase/carnithine racemase
MSESVIETEAGEALQATVSGAILRVVLNRPEYRNALTFPMYRGLAQLCAEPPAGCRAMIIHGAGAQAFAAGTDIRQFRDLHRAEDFLGYEQEIDRVLDSIETCPLPTIAAISGACTGGGAMIAAVCDLRIADAALRFGFPIARTLGNTLSARSLSRLAALMGPARTREMIFTSRLVAAGEALRVGIVSEVLDDHGTLMARAQALAELVTAQAPLTLRATKTLQHRLLKGDYGDEDMVLQCYQSEDFRHGLESFLAKRKPAWTGK